VAQSDQLSQNKKNKVTKRLISQSEPLLCDHFGLIQSDHIKQLLPYLENAIECDKPRHKQGSISPTFYEQLLRA